MFLFEKGTSEQIATACPECALDGGGAITAFDAKKLVFLWTKPRCATE